VSDSGYLHLAKSRLSEKQGVNHSIISLNKFEL